MPSLLRAVCLALAVAALPGLAAAKPLAGVAKAPFGHMPDGRAVDIYTLTNQHGLKARIMTLGATLVSLTAPDRNGHLADVVLGCDSVEPYLAGVPYFGATIGRYAGRIAGARFALDGRTYELPKNEGANTLHSGNMGFDKQLWRAAPVAGKVGPGLRLTYVSADGDAGFPGQLTVAVTYRLGNDNALTIDYRATTTAPTPVNLTNHAYFNLSGDPRHEIVDEVLMIDADRFLPVDAAHIPTGELRPVAGTPFDFRRPTAIGAQIDADDAQIGISRGYDNTWVLVKPRTDAVTTAAVVSDPGTGRVLEVRTTEPSLQVYTGNYLNGEPAGKGSVFVRRTGFTLETQHLPDSPNQPAFPSTILRPGQTFVSRTVYLFRTAK